MAGNANLGTNLIDQLVPVVDELRELQETLGLRQHRVYIVSRQWSNGRVGDGEATDTEVEILPRPLVLNWKARVSDLKYELEPCGLDEMGMAFIKEVSLTYTEADLVGEYIEGTEVFVKIEEGEGQATNTRYFTHFKPPFPDRYSEATGALGWHLYLKSINVEAI